ncbi:GrpB family protein [Paenibacillus turpanensis]|uniref:GrpB family protein n=1 Tax=Paenibacillus turpanensis TaxID=2689078 RepID=UPI00140C8EAB|nr:GrpB family protein [Paenibacillus turpanensis]
MAEEIKVVQYNPQWAIDFLQEKNAISSILGDEVIVIEHVGSTSIPGQEAKPIIDIFIGVSPFHEAVYYKSKFNSESYVYVQTDMKDRYLFNKFTRGVWTHNLHILPYDDEFYCRNELLFRDFLKEHPDLIEKYGELKKNLANTFIGNLEEYTRSKTEFIQHVIDSARREKGLPLQDVWTNELK